MKEISQETFAGGPRGTLRSVWETVKSVWRETHNYNTVRNMLD